MRWMRWVGFLCVAGLATCVYACSSDDPAPAASSSSSSSGSPETPGYPEGWPPPGSSSSSSGGGNVGDCASETWSTEKAQHNTAIAGATTIVFRGEGGIKQIPKPAGAGTEADTRSNREGVMLGDDYWEEKSDSLQKKDGTATGKFPSGIAYVMGRSGTSAFVGVVNAGTIKIYKVPLEANGTPTEHASTTFNGSYNEIVVQGKYVWFEKDPATGALGRFDMTAAAPAKVDVFTPPKLGAAWTVAGENVIFYRGFETGPNCTYSELHGPSGKIKDLPEPNGFCPTYTALRDPKFVYRIDSIDKGSSFTKLSTDDFSEQGTVCGNLVGLDALLATEDEKFLYINERHGGLVGEPLSRIAKP